MSHFVKGLLKQKQKAAKPSFLKRADGAYTKCPEEALLELASTYFPLHKPIWPGKYNRDKIPTSKIQNSFGTWISARKVKNILLQFKRKKEAGPNGLKPIIFSHMPEKKNFGILVIIYKAKIFTSFTQTKWKEAKVIFIPKPGKTVYQTARDFRLISLKKHLLKGL